VSRDGKGTFFGPWRSCIWIIYVGAPMYPWPADDVMNEALEIAMNYLSRTGHAVKFMAVQNVAVETIIAAWQAGVTHKIKLANCAIRAVETSAAEPTKVPSAYPRVM
jgi:hypothetical protein